jgi:hypothetical protein
MRYCNCNDYCWFARYAMSVLEEIINELRAIERELDGHSALARRVHKVAATLEDGQGKQINSVTPWGWVGKLPWRLEQQYRN